MHLMLMVGLILNDALIKAESSDPEQHFVSTLVLIAL